MIRAGLPRTTRFFTGRLATPGMPGAAYLQGDGLSLNTIEVEDLPFLRDTINDPAVRAGLLFRPPLNLAQEREYFEDVVCDDGSVNLLVCVEGEPAGTIGLESIDDVDGSAEIGLFLAEDHWGAGIGTEAARVLTEYAFEERRLHRVYARVRADNAASARIWEKLGYVHEATHREAVFHEGEHVDVERYAELASEWTG